MQNACKNEYLVGTLKNYISNEKCKLTVSLKFLKKKEFLSNKS